MRSATFYGRRLVGVLILVSIVGLDVRAVRAAWQQPRVLPDAAAEALERRATVRWEKTSLNETLAFLADNYSLSAIVNGDPLADSITLSHEGNVKSLLDRIGD